MVPNMNKTKERRNKKKLKNSWNNEWKNVKTTESEKRYSFHGTTEQ